MNGHTVYTLYYMPPFRSTFFGGAPPSWVKTLGTPPTSVLIRRRVGHVLIYRSSGAPPPLPLRVLVLIARGLEHTFLGPSTYFEKIEVHILQWCVLEW